MKQWIKLQNNYYLKRIDEPPKDPRTEEHYKFDDIIFEEPPQFITGRKARWTGEGWEYLEIPERQKDEFEKEFELKEKLKVMDQETQERIFEGFDFDEKKFSLSLSAQSNWVYLLTLFTAGQFPDEYSIATKEDEEYILKKEKAEAFFQAAAQKKETELAEGRKRKRELKESYAG